MSEEFKVVGFCIGMIIGCGFACAWFREYGRKNREKTLAIKDQKSRQ